MIAPKHTSFALEAAAPSWDWPRIAMKVGKVLRSSSLSKEHWIAHAVSTRAHGNISRRFGSTVERNVNRCRLFEAADIRAARFAEAEQVHGGRVAVVRTSDLVAIPSTLFSGVDGLLTNSPHVPLLVTTADCLPIFLVDPVSRSIGLLHAGWRSVASQICANAIELMQTEFGASPSNFLAFVGPSIGPCCFEVHHDVKDRFGRFHSAVSVLGRDVNKYSIDLRSIVRSQLAQLGVPIGNIECAVACTSCDEANYYSHRRDGSSRAGSMGSALMIRI